MQVEFEAPVDYEEPKRTSKKALPSEQPVLIDAKQIPGSAAFSAFDESGQRLGGGGIRKKGSIAAVTCTDKEGSSKLIDVATLEKHQRGVPIYKWKPGKLTFRRTAKKSSDKENAIAKMDLTPFTGSGFALLPKK